MPAKGAKRKGKAVAPASKRKRSSSAAAAGSKRSGQKGTAKQPSRTTKRRREAHAELLDYNSDVEYDAPECAQVHRSYPVSAPATSHTIIVHCLQHHNRAVEGYCPAKPAEQEGQYTEKLWGAGTKVQGASNGLQQAVSTLCTCVRLLTAGKPAAPPQPPAAATSSSSCTTTTSCRSGLQQQQAAAAKQKT